MSNTANLNIHNYEYHFRFLFFFQAITINIDNIPYMITINVFAHEEHSMNLFKYVGEVEPFYLMKTIYIAHPNDVASIFYKDTYYIAVSSGHLPDTMHSGRIEIYR